MRFNRRIPEPSTVVDKTIAGYFREIIRVVTLIFQDIEATFDETYLNENRINANFYDAAVSGNTYNASGSIDFHLVSAASSQCDVVIPEPSAAIGRRITVKRNNSSGGNVLVKRASTSAAEGFNYRLDNQYASVTLICNGNSWFELSKSGTVTGV
jgi:hypothetical protein